MKHFAETMALGMKGKLGKRDELPTTFSLRGVMRQFYDAWERHYSSEIPLDVKRLMVPVSGRISYIAGTGDELRL